MEDLTTWKMNQICLSCSKKFNYLQCENILYGFKETSPFCNDCYYTCLDKLVKFGRDLQGRQFFVGFGSKLEQDLEIKKYKQVRDIVCFVEHTIYPNLIAWCNLMESHLSSTL